MYSTDSTHLTYFILRVNAFLFNKGRTVRNTSHHVYSTRTLCRVFYNYDDLQLKGPGLHRTFEEDGETSSKTMPWITFPNTKIGYHTNIFLAFFSKMLEYFINTYHM
jgi:hypothetical protein